MSLDANTAGSSPAPETPAAPSAFASYEQARIAELRGDSPEPSVTPDAKPADPSPAPAAEQPASTEVKEAASEAAKPRKTAEDRKRELDADIQARLKRRHELDEEIRQIESRRNPTPQETRPKPASEPAPAAETFPNYDAWLEQHPEGSYEAYIDERADHRLEQRWAAKERESEAKAHRERESQTVRDRDAKFAEQIEAVKKADPDFITKLSPEVLELRPFEYLEVEQGPDGNSRLRDPQTGKYVRPGRAAVAGEMLSSPVAADLMRHFSTHPEDLQRLEKLTPQQLYKEIGKLEARFTDGPKAAPAAPPRKTVTDAPDPGTSLGNRPAPAADESRAAVARRDFAAYEASEISKALARRRR